MMSDIARGLECAKAKEEVESLRQRIAELKVVIKDFAQIERGLEEELAALKQAQGEPVAQICSWGCQLIGKTAEDFEKDKISLLGTPLYTSAPTIPEGWQLVRSTITPEVSLRMDELRDADTTNEYLYEVIIDAAAPKPEGA